MSVSFLSLKSNLWWINFTIIPIFLVLLIFFISLFLSQFFYFLFILKLSCGIVSPMQLFQPLLMLIIMLPAKLVFPCVFYQLPHFLWSLLFRLINFSFNANWSLFIEKISLDFFWFALNVLSLGTNYFRLRLHIEVIL